MFNIFINRQKKKFDVYYIENLIVLRPYIVI